MKRLFISLFLFGILIFLPINSWAGKFYFTLGYGLDKSEFNSAEFSLSSGGNYASTVDLGGTYYFNIDNLKVLSFDVFSSLDSIQEYNFLFAAGVRVFLISADASIEGADLENNIIGNKKNDFSYGLMPGFDIGYRFETRIPTILLWSLDYGPDLIVGGNLEEIIQTAIFYEAMFTPIVIGHLSYRYGTTKYHLSETREEVGKFENTLGLGIKIRF